MKKHNKIFAALALAAALLPLTACTDDQPQTVRLKVSTAGSGSKVYMDGLLSYFHPNDTISVMNTLYVLQSDGGNRWVDVAFPGGDCFVAFYPPRIVATVTSPYVDQWGSRGNFWKAEPFTFPRVYNYNASTGRIDIPMMAVTIHGENHLKFEHLSALIDLTFNFGSPFPYLTRIRIDSVALTANDPTVYLSGHHIAHWYQANPGEDHTCEVQNDENRPQNKHVSVHATDGIVVENGQSVNIPIPIAPNDYRDGFSDGGLTLTVYGQVYNTTGHEWNNFQTSTTYTFDQERWVSTRALVRASANYDGANMYLFMDPGGIESHDNNGNLW